MDEEPIFLSFAFRPQPNIGTDKSAYSQAQPYGICTYIIYLTQTHLYVEHYTLHSEAVGRNCKVFGITWPWMD